MASTPIFTGAQAITRLRETGARDGKPGPIAKKLLEMWNEDAKSAKDHLVSVPYHD